jgi:hypothetical protein
VQELLQQLVASRFAILWVIWFCGTVVVTLRALTKHLAYARHFPLLQRNTALWQRQTDLSLEQMRHQVWRRAGVAAVWELGVPLLTIGMIKLLAVIGLLHTP